MISLFFICLLGVRVLVLLRLDIRGIPLAPLPIVLRIRIVLTLGTATQGGYSQRAARRCGPSNKTAHRMDRFQVPRTKAAGICERG
jgi:hypothetical protein